DSPVKSGIFEAQSRRKMAESDNWLQLQVRVHQGVASRDGPMANKMANNWSRLISLSHSSRNCAHSSFPVCRIGGLDSTTDPDERSLPPVPAPQKRFLRVRH